MKVIPAKLLMKIEINIKININYKINISYKISITNIFIVVITNFEDML